MCAHGPIGRQMRGKLPPPVEGGTGAYGSRGRLIDRLMGDRGTRRLARRDVDHLFSARRSPADPPSVQLPAPVPASTKPTARTRLRFRSAKPRPAR